MKLNDDNWGRFPTHAVHPRYDRVKEMRVATKCFLIATSHAKFSLNSLLLHVLVVGRALPWHISTCFMRLLLDRSFATVLFFDIISNIKVGFI